MFEQWGQASGLARKLGGRGVQVIAVTSGKGGVGKTNVSVNLAVALAQQGKKVLLMDADLGLGNVDLLLGLRPRLNLSHVITGVCSLKDIMVEGPGGIRIVPASSGGRVADLGELEYGGLIRGFAELHGEVDVLVVDTGAGISNQVTAFTRAAQHIVVVLADEPASIADAYATIKVLSREHGRRRFQVLANMMRTPDQGRNLFLKLLKVSDRFLSVSLDFAGVIPLDPKLRRAVTRQRAVVEIFPHSGAALAFKGLATRTDNWSISPEVSGHLGFFVERYFDDCQGSSDQGMEMSG